MREENRLFRDLRQSSNQTLKRDLPTALRYGANSTVRAGKWRFYPDNRIAAAARILRWNGNNFRHSGWFM